MDINDFLSQKEGFIEKATGVAKEVTNGEVDLTTDLSSIEDLDKVIDVIHNLKTKGLVNDTVAWNSAVMFGTILGEMIIKEHGFHWAINSEDLPVVEKDSHNQMSPITKLYKIIMDPESMEGSAKGFYQGFLALEQYENLSEEEKAKITTYIGKE